MQLYITYLMLLLILLMYNLHMAYSKMSLRLCDTTAKALKEGTYRLLIFIIFRRYNDIHLHGKPPYIVPLSRQWGKHLKSFLQICVTPLVMKLDACLGVIKGTVFTVCLHEKAFQCMHRFQ